MANPRKGAPKEKIVRGKGRVIFVRLHDDEPVFLLLLPLPIPVSKHLRQLPELTE